MIESPYIAERDRLKELRVAFDSSFSSVADLAGEPTEDLLAIRVGDAPFAIRLSEIAGLYVDSHVTVLPDASAELLGISGFHGTIVAVYNLRVLLGVEATGSCRWLVRASTDSAVGLAFDRFEGHLRVLRSAIAAEEGFELTQIGPREAIRIADVLRPIVKIPALLEAVKALQSQ